MNEEHSPDGRELPDAAPGLGAGDAATSQAIPHLPRPAKKAAAKKTANKAPIKKASTNPPQEVDQAEGDDGADEVDEAAVVTETDKGRARELSTPTSAATTEVKPAAAQRNAETVSADRPLTAADYARTTSQSPGSTSVIPAVRDEPRPAPAPAAPPSASGRQASLRLDHVEPWSVARIAFAVSVAMMIVGVVAMTIFWVVLNLTGVWDQVNDAVTSVLSDDSSSFDITDYLGFGRLVGLTLVVSAINVVLMTALATIGAHLYNLAAQVLGGVEVTFSEEN